MKNCNTILTEKQQKYDCYHLEKVDKYEYFTSAVTLPFKQIEMLGQAKFAYFPLGKDFEKQTEEELDAVKSLDFSNKKMN